MFCAAMIGSPSAMRLAEPFDDRGPVKIVFDKGFEEKDVGTNDRTRKTHSSFFRRGELSCAGMTPAIPVSSPLKFVRHVKVRFFMSYPGFRLVFSLDPGGNLEHDPLLIIFESYACVFA